MINYKALVKLSTAKQTSKSWLDRTKTSLILTSREQINKRY